MRQKTEMYRDEAVEGNARMGEKRVAFFFPTFDQEED
jgi:hypothetical protein